MAELTKKEETEDKKRTLKNAPLDDSKPFLSAISETDCCSNVKVPSSEKFPSSIPQPPCKC